MRMSIIKTYKQLFLEKIFVIALKGNNPNACQLTNRPITRSTSVQWDTYLSTSWSISWALSRLCQEAGLGQCLCSLTGHLFFHEVFQGQADRVVFHCASDEMGLGPIPRTVLLNCVPL
jgi:hypothetical protein